MANITRATINPIGVGYGLIGLFGIGLMLY